jgi:hypothetical protein
MLVFRMAILFSQIKKPPGFLGGFRFSKLELLMRFAKRIPCSRHLACDALAFVAQALLPVRFGFT